MRKGCANRALGCIIKRMKRLIWFLAAVTVGVYITRPISDPDLWWHITVGKWILAHRQIPAVDHWTLFSAGLPWRAYSWSNELVYALFERGLGLNGVLLLHFCLGAALALSFFYCFGRLAADRFFGAFLGLIVTCACVEHFSLRPQTFTWILLVWLLFIADRVVRERLQWRTALGAALIMCLWANSHITTALGIVTAAAWSFRRDHPRDAVVLAGVCFAGTLCTPYLGGEWLTFFSKADHPLAFTTIREFGPATILNYSTGFAVLLLCLLVAFWQKLPSAVGPLRGVYACLMFIGGLAVIKFLPDASILLAALIAVVWRVHREGRAELGPAAEGFERLRALIEKLEGQGLAFLLLCLIIVSASRTVASGIDTANVPVDAVAFIKDHDLPHPILNDFNEGGYLMYAFSEPDGTTAHPVVIDGRTNLISKDLWADYVEANVGGEGWERFLNRVHPETILWENESPLTTILEVQGRWCRVFRSGGKGRRGFSVFLPRETADSKGLACS